MGCRASTMWIYIGVGARKGTQTWIYSWVASLRGDWGGHLSWGPQWEGCPQWNAAVTTCPSVCFGCRALALALLEVATAFEDRWGFLSRLFSQMGQPPRMEDLKKVSLVVLSGVSSDSVGICPFARRGVNAQRLRLRAGELGRPGLNPALTTSWPWTAVTWASLSSVAGMGK